MDITISLTYILLYLLVGVLWTYLLDETTAHVIPRFNIGEFLMCTIMWPIGMAVLLYQLIKFTFFVGRGK